MYNEKKLFLFLKKVDRLFPIPLSQKQDLAKFTEKLSANAMVCCELKQGEIVSLVAGYVDNVIDNIGYISIVATLPEEKGKGYASKLIKQFLSIAKSKNLDAVHLYTVESNIDAVLMYHKLGFVEYKISDETRPNDLHLIYYLNEVNI